MSGSGELRQPRSVPGFFSSAAVLSLPVGERVRPGELRGYHIDFSRKATTPEWPPHWLPPRHRELFVATAQWGLGAYERYLRGDGDEWLEAAAAAADHLVDRQERDGRHNGGWIHRWALGHTYELEPPWISGMAQGEGASLLLRVYSATADDRLAEAGVRALKPLALPVADGGARTDVGSGFILEEYPTNPPSLVLNGALFALWGYYDAAVGIRDADVMREFDLGLDTLAANVNRWDTGRWSRYDLFDHRVVNVASSFYHDLHINQLRAMERIASRAPVAEALERFERYRASRVRRAEAFARKALFRVAVPRNRWLAGRSPFGPRRRR